MLASLPTPAEMSHWDRAAAALGLPELLLMENASREALHVLRLVRPRLEGRRILAFMGSGNNGGDAACLARHLQDEGAEVLVVHTRPLSTCRGAAGRHVRLARRCGVRFVPAASRAAAVRNNPELAPWRRPDLVIDGLLGTGFSGTLRPPVSELVREINELRDRAFILALDIPSGLSGLTGRPCPDAVRAHATVTFEAAKPGTVLPEAAPYVGRLYVRRIGIPGPAKVEHPASFRLLGPDLGAALPGAEQFLHKGMAGHVLVAGGSPGLTGAPHLAALGALRAGAGLVTAAAPTALCAAIKAGSPDIMTLFLGNEAQRTTEAWSPDLLPALLPLLRRCSAAVVGPGLGRSATAAAFVGSLLAVADRPPCVVDADALHALAVNPDFLYLLRPGDVLTPHPGEAGLLLGLSSAEVQADRFAALEQLKAKTPGVWVLKGAGTLIGRQGDPSVVSPYHVPALAVGGSGDVLAGCTAALIAQGMAPFLAACAGVLLHAEAGLVAAQNRPQRGNTAADIADALPSARAHLAAGSTGASVLLRPHE